MKRVRYPNGFVGVANDKAAAVLARKPGHCIVTERPDDEQSQAKDKNRSPR